MNNLIILYLVSGLVCSTQCARLAYKPRIEEAPKDTEACQSGFTLCNNRCFKYIFEVVKTQAGAQEFCQQAFGGWLPAALDSAGLDCLKQIGKPAFTATGSGLWIAGNDLALFGTWLYEGYCKTNPVGFIDWGQGRPSGSNHCLELVLTTNGPKNADLDCAFKFGEFLCEVKISEVGAPCPEGFTYCPSTDRCLMYVKQPWQTQAGAQEYCRKNFGGWLPASVDQAGQDCLITVAKPAFSETGYGVWIAGNDLADFSSWVYNQGCVLQSVGFMDWDSGKPSGTNHCIALLQTTSGPVCKNPTMSFKDLPQNTVPLTNLGKLI